MTTYGAYDRGLPCRNPACNSHGKPHPNCRCYGEFAKGGEASFCSAERAHAPDCEYFAGGGEASPDFIPDDQPPSGAQAEPPTSEASPDFIPDEPSADAVEPNADPDFIPDDNNEHLSPAELQAKMVMAANPNGPSPAEAPVQQLATLQEGFGEGLLGPLFPPLAKHLADVPYEDMSERRAANPGVHAIGETAGLALGLGAGAVASGVGKAFQAAGNAAKLAVDFAELGKFGSAVIRGAGEMMALQASDEATKAILGHGNPEAAHAPFAALGSAAVLGAFMGGSGLLAASLATKAVEKLVPLASHADMLLSGLGAAQRGDALGPVVTGLSKEEAKWFTRGYEAFSKFPERIGTVAKTAGAVTGGAHGASSGMIAGGGEALAGYASGKLVSYFVEPLAEGARDKAGKYMVPAINRWLGGGARGSIYHVKNYVERVAKGQSRINNALDGIFKASAQQEEDIRHDPKRVEQLRKWVDDGGMTPHLEAEMADPAPAGFARGGEVKTTAPAKAGVHTDDLHETLPEQAALLSVTRGRLSTHLSSQRPQKHTPRLAFDPAPDQKQAEKNYTSALQLAVSPLSIMKRISDGSLSAKDVHHVEAMYPELMGHLRKEATGRIVKDQVAGRKPPYKVRQALSLFMGVPLSSELTPAMIQAAQATFAAAKQATQTPQGGGKTAAKQAGKSSALSKSDRAYLTDDQARMARDQNAR